MSGEDELTDAERERFECEYCGELLSSEHGLKIHRSKKHLTTFVERFWDKVDIEKKKECWEWQGAECKREYGCFDIGKVKMESHRVSWILDRKEYPEQDILHKCDNTSCVNPNHLYQGSKLQNSIDAVMREGQDTKLTIDEVKTIKSRLKNGGFATEIAKDYPVSRSAISKIENEETWSYV